MILLAAILLAAGWKENTFAMSAKTFSDRKIFSNTEYKLRYDATKLNVNFGENYRMNLWAHVEAGSLGELKWQVKAGSLPDGLTLISSGPQSAVIVGTVRFLGQWCVQVSSLSQYAVKSVDQSFCIQSATHPNSVNSSPKLSPTDKILKSPNGRLSVPPFVSSALAS